MRRAALLVIYILSAIGFAAQGTYGADTNTPRTEISDRTELLLEEIRAMIDREDYATAREELRAANTATPQNADILNLLGFVFRKIGQLGDAAAYYAQALDVDPTHKGALEYQGELYLLLDRPEKAKANLQLLGELCARNCEEYEDLAKDVAAYDLAN